MAAQPSPTVRRRRLGRRLKRLREGAGMTLDAAARQLDKDRSALNRMELGKTRIDVNVVRTMMDIYDVRDDSLIELARQALKRGWWTVYGVQGRGYIGMETEATMVLESTLVYVPGLLQTHDYMRALFAVNPARWTEPQLENQVGARRYRQRRLVDEEAPLAIHAIIDEAALRKKVGGPEVMRAQLRHLVERATLDTVTIQVLPDDSGAHSGMDGAFVVLEFAEEEDPDLLYVSYPTGSIHVEKAEELRQARMVFDRLRTEALSPRDSMAFIERMA